MTAYEMTNKMIRKPKPDAVKRLEKAQDDARKQKKIVKEALEAIRLSKPYRGSKDTLLPKEWNDSWIG
jgi:hypothetical protein